MAESKKMRRRVRRGAPWTVSEVKQLGKVPDSVLARRTGRTIKEIVAEQMARRSRILGGPRRRTAREIKLLGRLNDAEVAARLGRNVTVVQRRRWRLRIAVPRIPGVKASLPKSPRLRRRLTAGEERLLGTAPDKEIAACLQIGLAAVERRRQELKIAVFGTKGWPLDDAMAARTGRGPDRETKLLRNATQISRKMLLNVEL
jgi:hypothetical protein